MRSPRPGMENPALELALVPLDLKELGAVG